MKKKELLTIIEDFDDDAILVASTDSTDFLDLESNGFGVNGVVEVNTGTKKYIVLSE